MMSTDDLNIKFWEIVTENHLRDEVISVAADDMRLQRVTRWLLTDESYYGDTPDLLDFESLKDIITADYCLLPNQIDAVADLCKANIESTIYEELNHGH